MITGIKLYFRKLLPILTVSFVFSGMLIHAQAKGGMHSIENRELFGNHLFEQKDYIRAIDEFLYVLQKESNDTIQFKVAYAYQGIGEFDVSNDYLHGLFFNEYFGRQSILEYYKNNFFLLPSESFNDVVDEGRFLSESTYPIVNSLRNLSNLVTDIPTIDSIEYIKPFDLQYKEDAAKFYSEKLNPGFKSQTTAAILSAVIPGLGKVYTGNLTDGLTGFLVTGILSFLAYDNFRADHDFRAWLFTGLAAYFYAGNVYGSMASADLYNAGIKIYFKDRVEAYLKKSDYFIPKYEFVK